MSIIGFPFSMRWPQAVMYQSRSPQLMIFDSCSVHVSRMLDDLEPARYHIVGLWPAPSRPIMETSRLSLSKRKFMVIHQNPAIKHLVFQRLSLFYANSVVKTITLTPIVVREPQSVLCQFCDKNNHSNADCRTRTSEFTNNQNRPYVGLEAHGRLVKATGDRDWIPNFKELKGLMSKAGQSSGSTPSASKTV